MTDKNNGMSIDEWHETIAGRAGSTPAVVANMLDTLQIRPRPILPRVRTLNLTSVQMTGMKYEKDHETPFTFEWTELSDGLWALLSEGNFKGKSSILAVFRAAVQGRFPGKIKRDVWSWITTVNVRFKVDDAAYEIALQKPPKETDENKAEASLTRTLEGQELSLYAGPAGDALRAAVEDVFMDELGFDRFHAYRSAKATVVEHGWSALSSALFITGPGAAVFGDHTEDALPLRLIQMFIGLPWVSTYTAVSTALKRVKSEQDKAQGGAAADRAKIVTRIQGLQEEKKKKEVELSQFSDRGRLRTELSTLDRRLAEEQAEITYFRNELDKAQILAQDTSLAHAEARRMHQQAKDEAAAGYIFRKLQPVCCPACEANFQPGRFSAKVTQACGLCGSEELSPDEHEASDFSHLEMAVNDSNATQKTATEGFAKARNQLYEAEEARAATLKRLKTVGEDLSNMDRTEKILHDIAGIDGRIEELTTLLPDATAEASPKNEVLRVLSAAEAVTKQAMEGLQAEIMGEVEKELFGFAERFGVRNLETLSFKAHRMDLRQGGVDVTFSGLNAGENLRIRVAAALATLKVARSRGFGRHPGLLVLDSPAASEMSVDDFSALIGAVATTVKEIAGVQVIVGAVIRPELGAVVPHNRCRVAVGTDTLF